MAQEITVTQCNPDEYVAALKQLQPKLDQPVSFLQAPFYGAWQQQTGKAVIYYAIWENKGVIGAGIAIQYHVPLGKLNFLYSPYGPVVTTWTPATLQALRDFFKPICNRLGSAFVRLDSEGLADLPDIKPASNTMAAMASLQPRAEWLLDITPPAEKLLSGQHKKARYFVRLAERDEYDVRVEFAKPSPEHIQAFYELLRITSERDHFGIMSQDYYQAVFSALDETNSFLGFCYVGNKLAAAAVCVMFDKQAHYVFGCSSDDYRKLAPAYHLQWRVILEAKARGCTLYNFGGIADTVKGTHLQGVTTFKKRFGGYALEHRNPVDLVYKPLQYQLFHLYKSLRHSTKR